MSSTLDSLHRAVISDPADRTVRLVYADALDETGLAADAARAEFIRAQIEVAACPQQDTRHALAKARCGSLFEGHWVEWWRPVCEAAGLPAPYVPRRRTRQRMIRRSGPGDANWPYTHTAANTTVQFAAYGLSVQFAGGFPEEVRFLSLEVPENWPELAHRWGDVMPLVHLSFASQVTPEQWARVAGPHLSRLPELTFDRLAPEATASVVATPHLAALTRLTVNPIGGDVDAVRSLVSGAPWAGLRSLRFTGLLLPNVVRDLATFCRLERLEELELVIGNPVDLIGVVGRMLGQLLRQFTQSLPFPAAGAQQWPEYGAALEVLASAPWVRRLRRLRISAGGLSGVFGLLAGRTQAAEEQGEDVLPDGSLRVLAGALEGGPLERLELPAAAVGPVARGELVERLRDRVVFA